MIRIGAKEVDKGSRGRLAYANQAIGISLAWERGVKDGLMGVEAGGKSSGVGRVEVLG